MSKFKILDAGMETPDDQPKKERMDNHKLGFVGDASIAISNLECRLARNVYFKGEDVSASRLYEGRRVAFQVIMEAFCRMAIEKGQFTIRMPTFAKPGSEGEKPYEIQIDLTEYGTLAQWALGEEAAEEESAAEAAAKALRTESLRTRKTRSPAPPAAPTPQEIVQPEEADQEPEQTPELKSEADEQPEQTKESAVYVSVSSMPNPFGKTQAQEPEVVEAAADIAPDMATDEELEVAEAELEGDAHNQLPMPLDDALQGADEQQDEVEEVGGAELAELTDETLDVEYDTTIVMDGDDDDDDDLDFARSREESRRKLGLED